MTPENLVHIRDLEAFDGPILSELRDEDSNVYVSKWCAWGIELIVKTSSARIEAYLQGAISFFDLLVQSDNDRGHLAHHDRGVWSGVEATQVSTLPSNYLPNPSAFHDPSLRPSP